MISGVFLIISKEKAGKDREKVGGEGRGQDSFIKWRSAPSSDVEKCCFHFSIRELSRGRWRPTEGDLAIARPVLWADSG